MDVEPLLDCADPSNIKKQLDALRSSYDSLWKVYLFLHPVFQDEIFRKTHEEVQEKLDEFAAKYTGIIWRNAVDFEQLLGEALDNVSYFAQSGGPSVLEEEFIPIEVGRLLGNLKGAVPGLFPATDGKISVAVTAFEKAAKSKEVKSKLGKSMQDFRSRKMLHKLVDVATEIFRDLPEKDKEPFLREAARNAEKAWQILIERTIESARRKLRKQPSNPVQTELSESTTDGN